eukprot:scaffold75_cov165-Amphora_coffeaeformis.AAC.10
MRNNYRTILLLDIIVALAYIPLFIHRGRLSRGGAHTWFPRLDLSSDGDNNELGFSEERRALIAGALASQALLFPLSSSAINNPILSRFLDRPSSLYIVSPENNVTATPQREPLFSEPYYLSSEICLLKLLPVKNPVFRSLETDLISLSSLETTALSPEVWEKATNTMEVALENLDNKRGKLEPVFNPEDSTRLAISKGERGERLIEELRRGMVRLLGSTKAANLTKTLNFQKEALIALSDVGELLVEAFPYDKRLGTSLADFDVANLPIFGSYQEGFYDPLTAKPRRIPLEIIRVEKSNGSPNLSYLQGLTEISSGRASVEPTSLSRPLLSFNIPGLVALNHPDQKENGASSEFFALQDGSIFDDRRKLLDGEYAPFGYIVDGYEVFNGLKAGDVIEQTYVDEWGTLNLKKIRRSSFSEVVQSSGDPNATVEES